MSGVYFAYDGSLHGDWVSHYAVRMAAASAEKKLHLVHVRDDRTSDSERDAKLGRIRAECRRLGVETELHLPPPAQSALAAIRASVPPGPDSYLVCGTRSREHKRGLLSGTVAERLLRARHCHVLAIRVVQPGLLGLPRQLLLPVSGHPRGFRSGLPMLRLLAPDVSHLQILYVARVGRWRFRLLSRESAEQLRRPGQAYCDRIEQEIRAQLGPAPPVVDAHVVVSDDVPKEIVIAANKAQSRLIYLGASERNLSERFFFGNPVEQVLRDATCDVAIYRGLA